MIVSLVQFREAGKKYYFSLNGLDLNREDKVIVETIRGLEMGIIYRLKEVDESSLTQELKPILRLATAEDIENYNQNREAEPAVVEKTKDLVEQLELDMKVLNAEYTLDKKKLLIYFEAEHRVDFRELVRELSSIYHTRIELRQIGSRDAAKMIGGIGPCGLIFCCTTFIGSFETISIRMAKNQNLALNPQKISGACGKLLCCIKYEDDVYTELKEGLPNIGDRITLQEGPAQVTNINILKQRIQIKYLDENANYQWLEFNDYKGKKVS